MTQIGYCDFIIKTVEHEPITYERMEEEKVFKNCYLVWVSEDKRTWIVHSDDTGQDIELTVSEGWDELVKVFLGDDES